MTIPVAIMAAVLVALLAGILAFSRYSRSPAWRTSEVRMATMRFLVIIGPFFGARVDMPDPTPTTISTPGPDPEAADIPGVEPRRPAALEGRPDSAEPAGADRPRG